MTTLILGDNNIFGSLPDFQGIPKVQNIDFNLCNLSGPIPDFSGIPELQVISLFSNNLSGNIPDFSAIPNLFRININANALIGNIPDFTNLANCVNFFASANMLTGPIPNFSNLPLLDNLQLNGNQLEGSIPGFENCPNLIVLNLSANLLTGSIPDFNLSMLNEFYAVGNQLTGSIPDFTISTSLQKFHVNNNALTGPVTVFTNVTDLLEYEVNSNALTGEIPDLSFFPNLSDFQCASNNLEGCFPDFVCGVALFNSAGNVKMPWEGDHVPFCDGMSEEGASCNDGDASTINDQLQADCSCLGIPNCRELDSLVLVDFYNTMNGPGWNNPWDLNDLMDNWQGVTLSVDGCVTGIFLYGEGLVGNLSDWVLPELTVLAIGNSQVTGPIPDFQNMPKLESLQIIQNELNSSIPDFSGIPNVRTINFSNNSLTGSVPDFSFIPDCELINISSNQVSGFLIDFGNLPNLTVLDLSRNNISGPIPNFQNIPLLTELILSDNQFVVSIPDFSNLTQLNTLSLDQNDLSGSIPNFSSIPDLQVCELHTNQLTGFIPGFNGVNDLQNLDLTNNLLTGEIPDLSGFINLFNLDLRNNNLSGCYPSFVCDVATVDLSQNPLLPWQGDHVPFCNGEDELTAPCDDSNLSSTNDQIQADCSCAGQIQLVEIFQIVPDTVKICYADCETMLIPLAFSQAGVYDTIAWRIDEPPIANAGFFNNLDQFGVTSLTITSSVGPPDFFYIESNMPDNFTAQEGDLFGAMVLNNINGIIGDGDYVYLYQDQAQNVDAPNFVITDSVYIELIDYSFVVNGNTNGSFLTGFDISINTLSEAITCANVIPGPNTITFDVPGNGPHNLFVSNLDTLKDDGTIIDASNVLGLQPAIRLISGIDNQNGMVIEGDNCEINGLGMADFDLSAIKILAEANNTRIGKPGGQNYIIASGNGVKQEGSGSTFIQNNIFGDMPSSGFLNESNALAAISVSSNANVLDNEIYGTSIGIEILDGFANTVQNNTIGSDTQNDQLFNGIEIENASSNEIALNSFYGCRENAIIIADVTGPDNSNSNYFRDNTFRCSQVSSVNIESTNNNSKSAPLIEEAKLDGIRGIAEAGDQITVYGLIEDDCYQGVCEGNYIIEKTTADADGNWEILPPYTFGDPVTGELVLATAFDNDLNSSEFSNCLEFDICSVPPEVNIVADPPVGCEGDIIELSTVEDFDSFNWNDLSFNDSWDLSESTDVFLTVTDENGCTATSFYQLFLLETPTANDDVLSYDDAILTLDPIINDELNGAVDYSIEIVSPPLNGNAFVDADNQIVYEASSQFGFTDLLSYQLCNIDCDDNCSIAEVRILYEEDEDTPKTILLTPENDDGVNDTAILIENVEDYPNNKVVIFNEWGDLVFERENYQNDWRGTGKNGDFLAQGTYYFYLTFFDDSRPASFGYIVLLK